MLINMFAILSAVRGFKYDIVNIRIGVIINVTIYSFISAFASTLCFYLLPLQITSGLISVILVEVLLLRIFVKNLFPGMSVMIDCIQALKSVILVSNLNPETFSIDSSRIFSDISFICSCSNL